MCRNRRPVDLTSDTCGLGYLVLSQLAGVNVLSGRMQLQARCRYGHRVEWLPTPSPSKAVGSKVGEVKMRRET